MMFVTHTNSVYAEQITLLNHIPCPQYVHQISDGGFVVKRGIKIMPVELINYVLEGKHGAETGTYLFLKTLLQKKNHKVGLILAAGGNVWTGYSSVVKHTEQHPTNKITPMGVSQVQAGHIANKIGYFDYIATDSTSCISGHSAWYNAYNMLCMGRLDAVVVISIDNGISEEYLDTFGEYGLSMLAAEENDPTINKFRLGQGCNITVFEKQLRTDCVPLAKIDNIHIAAEWYPNALGIAPEGNGYIAVIDATYTQDLDFIKTHSTFSKDNEIEQTIIDRYYPKIRTINYKLRIGHTMGASTAIETALAIKEESGKFLSLGAGMGNVFSAVIVEIL